MVEWRVPLFDVALPEEAVDAVGAVYQSGWLSMGPRTAALEREFSQYVGSQHAIATASGTAALHLICVAAGLGPGDEVVVPSLTFVATVNAIAYTGAQPVFVDIAGLNEPWMAASEVEGLIGDRTKAIMTVAYGGYPGELIEIRELAADRGVLLLEDAAHAVGSRLKGKHLGTLGIAGAFSFFSNKNLGIGEGGMVVTDDASLAERMALLRSHGMTTLTWDRHRGHASGYDVVALGFNYRIDEPRAELVRHLLRRLDEDNLRRAQVDHRYRTAFAQLDGLTVALPPPPGATLSYHLFTIVLDRSIGRDSFRSVLAEHGVQTSLHYPPAHRFSIYAEVAPDLPLTDAYAERAVTLPMFPHMTNEQMEIVIETVTNAVQRAQSR